MGRFILLLNKYVRRTGKIVNIFLAQLIFILYGLEVARIINIPVVFEVIFFMALTFNNLLFLFYAISLKNEFEEQISIYHNKGIPLDSTEGFQYSKEAVEQSVSRSMTLNIMIILGDILHFTPDIFPLSSTSLTFISYFGISMVLIGMSLFLNIEYPDHSLLEPGNFISYHKPKSMPSFLDNILADSLKSFLDPRTRFQLDNWLLDIADKLQPGFEKDEDEKTRVERAIERIILVLYLQKKVPNLVTEEIVRGHLRQIIILDKKQEFIDGDKSGLSLNIFSNLIDRMMVDVPEIFKLVDRLLVEVMVNPSLFAKADKIIETVIPDEKDLDVKETFRVLVYVLNMADTKNKRVIEVIAESSRHIEPPITSIKFELDAAEENILKMINQSERINGEMVYSDRIVEILSNMLQVGDATWLTFIPQEYGKHVLNLAVKENEFQSFGASVPLDVQFSLKNNLKKLMSSLSGLGGAIYPVLKALFFNPIF